ncbi:MAG: peptidylprolyl isomerase, partial [Myxococcota bacterium]|nr:peptidylprolyl isomerase [Myxococcota bacterium]
TGVGDAAFGLEVGVVSEVLRGDQGFHIVWVEEKIPGGVRSYEDVASELSMQGARLAAASQQAQALSSDLTEAIRNGSSLEDAARAKDLTLARTGEIRRRPDSYVADLGAVPELLAAAFALEAGESSPRVFEVGERLVLIQVLEHTTPSDAELNTQGSELRELALSQKRTEFISGWIREAEARLQAGGRLRVNASLVTGS